MTLELAVINECACGDDFEIVSVARVRVHRSRTCASIMNWSFISEEGSAQTVGSLAIPLTPPWRSSRTWRWERSAAFLGDPLPAVTSRSPPSVLARLCNDPLSSLSAMTDVRSHCGIHRVRSVQLANPEYHTATTAQTKQARPWASSRLAKCHALHSHQAVCE